MFGVGFLELVVILVIALVAVGPERLPELAKAIGKIFADLKSASNELRRSVSQDTETAPPGPGLKPKTRDDAEPEGKGGGERP